MIIIHTRFFISYNFEFYILDLDIYSLLSHFVISSLILISFVSIFIVL